MTVKELSRRCLKIDTKKFDPLLLKFFIHSRFLKKLQTLYENLNYNSWISWLRSILRKKKKHAKLKAFKAVGESRLATLFASCLEKFTQNRLKYLWAPKKKVISIVTEKQHISPGSFQHFQLPLREIGNDHFSYILRLCSTGAF